MPTCGDIEFEPEPEPEPENVQISGIFSLFSSAQTKIQSWRITCLLCGFKYTGSTVFPMATHGSPVILSSLNIDGRGRGSLLSCGNTEENPGPEPPGVEAMQLDSNTGVSTRFEGFIAALLSGYEFTPHNPQQDSSSQEASLGRTTHRPPVHAPRLEPCNSKPREHLTPTGIPAPSRSAHPPRLMQGGA